jgi:hypothetical protein
MGLHFAAGMVGLSVTSFLVLLGASADITDRQAMWGAVGVGCAIILIQLIIALWNPNRSPQANRGRAKQLLRSGDMELLRGETPEKMSPRLPCWGFGPVQCLALAGMALANLLFVAAELVRGACGWPMNPEWIPGVIGPGDESRLYFAEGFRSLRGMWSGEPSACLLNAHELGLDGAALPAQTKRGSWDGTIRFKPEEGSQARTPWVQVRVPDSPRLTGKQLQVRADLVAVFPVIHGNHYENEERAFTRTTSVQLADRPGAGQLYAYVWYGGGFAGAAWLGLMSLVLMAAAWSLRRRAFPLKVVHDKEDEPDDEDEDEDDEDKDDRYDRRRRRRRRDD